MPPQMGFDHWTSQLCVDIKSIPTFKITSHFGEKLVTEASLEVPPLVGVPLQH